MIGLLSLSRLGAVPYEFGAAMMTTSLLIVPHG